jgi:hypothetical protein
MIRSNPPNDISLMSAIVSTSGRLHSEFVRLLFLQAYLETHHTRKPLVC